MADEDRANLSAGGPPDSGAAGDSPADATFEVRALAARDSLAMLTELMHRGYAALAARGMNLFAATQTEEDTRVRTLSGQTFVAAHGRALVGTITVSSPLDLIPGSLAATVPLYREPGGCRFHQFAIDPDWRGRGVAQGLLEHAEDWARARNYRTMATDMAEEADELCGFYHRMGYRVVDHMRLPGRTYRSVVMKKALESSPLLMQTLMLARYNAWATACLLDSLASLSEADYRRPLALPSGSIHETLNSLMLGEHHLWWARFAEGTSTVGDAATLAEPDRQRLAQRLIDGAARWAGVIESWSHDRLQGPLQYRDSHGDLITVPLGQALAHVFYRGTHFRGLISAALIGLGHPVPRLELIRMLQEEASST